MPQDTGEIVVAGNGRIFVAPSGTAGPADVATAWAPAWVDLGLATEDGVTVTKGRDTTELNVWQLFGPARVVVTGESLTFAFSLVQWNPDTFALAMGGGSWVVAGAVATYTPPTPGAMDERAVGVEWEDGDYTFRMFSPRAVLSEDVAFQLQRTAMAELPITMATIAQAGVAPFTLRTDHPAVVDALGA